MRNTLGPCDQTIIPDSTKWEKVVPIFSMWFLFKYFGSFFLFYPISIFLSIAPWAMFSFIFHTFIELGYLFFLSCPSLSPKLLFFPLFFIHSYVFRKFTSVGNMRTLFYLLSFFVSLWICTRGSCLRKNHTLQKRRLLSRWNCGGWLVSYQHDSFLCIKKILDALPPSICLFFFFGLFCVIQWYLLIFHPTCCLLFSIKLDKCESSWST